MEWVVTLSKVLGQWWFSQPTSGYYTIKPEIALTRANTA